MKSVKRMWYKMMNRTMLSCDEATFFITKAEYQKLSFLESLKLKMHLMGCKFCRRFNIQSTFITKALYELHTHHDDCKLQEHQKIQLKKSIPNNS